MSLLELKSLMSLGAKERETGQVCEANCDMAERQGEPYTEGLSNSYQPAKAKISKGKRTYVC